MYNYLILRNYHMHLVHSMVVVWRRYSMRRIGLLIIIGLLLLGFTGCSVNTSNENNMEKEDEYGEIDDEVVDSADPQVEKTFYESSPSQDKDVHVINIWIPWDSYADIINLFIDTHPDFPYELRITDLHQTNFDIDWELSDTLKNNGSGRFDLPDIYIVDMVYANRYTQGDNYQYAADYRDLGIDVDKLLVEASIPKYFIDLCTSPEGKLVGLGYENTCEAFIYRRSIAKEVWQTDDPEIVETIIGPGWEKFFEAAKDLSAKNYSICSGVFDIWKSVANSADESWLVDDKLYIDPKREEFIDLAKELKENDFTNNTRTWDDEWYIDMKGQGDKEVFAFFGPLWFVEYVLSPSCGGENIGEGTYGDWAICKPPMGSYWGGSIILAHKDTKHKEAVGEIIKWITLDTSETGFQYLWANGADLEIVNGVPLSVRVANNFDEGMDLLGGQDIYDVYTSVAEFTRGDNISMYDESIDHHWLTQVVEYIDGNKSKKQAIEDFKQNIYDRADYYGIVLE